MLLRDHLEVRYETGTLRLVLDDLSMQGSSQKKNEGGGGEG